MANIKWTPLEHQRAPFFDDSPYVGLVAGYGCVAKGTKVQTPNGLKEFTALKPFDEVYSYDNGEIVISRCLGAYRKGLDTLYRVTHEHGEFVATGAHRTFSDHCKYLRVSEISPSSRLFWVKSIPQGQPYSNLAFYPPRFHVSAHRLTQKVLDYVAHYLTYLHQYGLQLRQAISNGLIPFPLQDGVKEFCHSFDFSLPLHTDVLAAHSLEHNHHDLLTSLACMKGYQCHDGNLVAVLEGRNSSLAIERTWQNNQSVSQSHGLYEHRHKELSRENDHISLQKSLSTKIIRIREWSIGNYYDTHVIGTNNYITEDGTIHHNSGKSSWLVHKLLRLCNQNKGLDGGILVPDLKMFKRDLLPLIDQVKRDNNITINYNRQDGFLYIPYTDTRLWIFHDQDKGESIRGPNLAFFGVNEATLISKEGFEAAIGRVRLKEAKVPQIAWSGTPEGFGYLYREHVEKQRTDSKVYYGSTVANTHLHQSFVDRLKSSYDETLLKAYLNGQFVNLTGRPAAYAFNRKFHVEQCRITPGRYSVWVALDFNVNPMAATLFYRVTDMGNLRLWAFDCIKLRSSDTNEMARVIKEKVGTNCTIYPDPAGNSRSTKNISVTDITILEDAGFKDIKFKRRIASVRECLNALNNMLSKNEIMFDPKCVDAINDLEQTELKDSGELDKSDQDRTHFIDGIKNMVDYEFPIVKPVGSSTIRL